MFINKNIQSAQNWRFYFLDVCVKLQDLYTVVQSRLFRNCAVILARIGLLLDWGFGDRYQTEAHRSQFHINITFVEIV